MGQHHRPTRWPVVVELIRLSAGTLDDDNLVTALKSVRDGVADWLCVDDGSDHVDWWYGQEKVKRGTWGVRVSVKGQ
jgi:hypothetical protein